MGKMGLGSSLVEREFGHGVVFAVAGPELSTVLDCCRSDQGIADFQAMTFAVLPEECAGQFTDLLRCYRACQDLEEACSFFLFLRPSARPYFCCCHRRVKNGSIRIRECLPPRLNDVVSRSKNFNHDVGIEKDVQSIPSLSMRSSSRKFRMYVSVSGKSARSFQSPTMPSIADLRCSDLSE